MKTDLAGEIIDSFSGEPFPGRKSGTLFGLATEEIVIETPEEARRIGKPAGHYHTLEVRSVTDPSADFDRDVLALSALLTRFLPSSGTVFVAGIGNAALTSDSLGAKSLERLLTGSYGNRRLCALSTGVCGKTGFSPDTLVSTAVRAISPSLVVLTDALAAEKIDRVGKTVQLTDAGLWPGSGVGNARFELSEKTLGVPVVALGLPTVVPFDDESKRTLTVSPGDIDAVVEKAARLFSLAIDLAVFPDLGLPLIKDLVF